MDSIHQEQILNGLQYKPTDTITIQYKNELDEPKTINMVYIYKKTSPSEINYLKLSVEEILALCATNPEEYNYLTFQSYETRWGVYSILFHKSRKRLETIENNIINRIERGLK